MVKCSLRDIAYQQIQIKTHTGNRSALSFFFRDLLTASCKLNKLLLSEDTCFIIYRLSRPFYTTLLMTVVDGTVALNISSKGLLSTVVLRMMKKWFLLRNIPKSSLTKSIPYWWPKRLKNPSLWGGTSRGCPLVLYMSFTQFVGHLLNFTRD